jgi:hypothetical protein
MPRMKTMTDELCAYWCTDDWCGCNDVLRNTPDIRCPFASDDGEQKMFCKYYTYHGISKECDGKYSIIINGKKIITGMNGEDIVVLRYLLEEFNDTEEL